MAAPLAEQVWEAYGCQGRKTFFSRGMAAYKRLMLQWIVPYHVYKDNTNQTLVIKKKIT